jgi:hypothetical protein
MSIDFGNSEFFQCTSCDGYALGYFQRFDVETLDQLGVYLIEGEQPASSFSEAVLREDMDYANQVARGKGLSLDSSSLIKSNVGKSINLIYKIKSAIAISVIPIN